MDDSHVKDAASQEKPPSYLNCFWMYAFCVLAYIFVLCAFRVQMKGSHEFDLLHWMEWLACAWFTSQMTWNLMRHLRHPGSPERLLFQQAERCLSPKQRLFVLLLSIVVGLLWVGVAIATDQIFLWWLVPPSTFVIYWHGVRALANHAHSPDYRWVWSHLADQAACLGSGLTASYFVLGLLIWTQGVNVQSDQYDGPWVFSGLGAPTQNMWLDTDEYTEIHGLKVKHRAVPKWPEGLDDEAFDEPCTFRFFIDEYGDTVDARPEGCDDRLHEAVREALLQWRWGGKDRNREKQQTWRTVIS